MSVVIVDTGLGNLRSVEKSVAFAAQRSGAKLEVRRSGDPDEVRRAERLVVPGQGGFGALARAIEGALREALLERMKAGAPYLGICLGLQILFDASDEAPGARGLGWFRGTVKRLAGGAGIKVPHMGWNQLELRSGGHPFLAEAGGEGTWVYFVHSYHAAPEEADVVRAVSSYGTNTITAAVARDNVFASQFHPEKSQKAGIALLEAFLRA